MIGLMIYTDKGTFISMYFETQTRCKFLFFCPRPLDRKSLRFSCILNNFLAILCFYFKTDTFASTESYLHFPVYSYDSLYGNRAS